MTDATETIWLFWPLDGGPPVLWLKPCPFPADDAEVIGYTSTDISQAIIQEKDERIEELEAACEVVSQEFEDDLWVACRRLLTKTYFDFSASSVDGIHADDFEGHMNETLKQFDISQTRIAELEGVHIFNQSSILQREATIVDLEHKLGMVAAYLKDMTERGDDEAKALLDGLDLDYEYDDE
jgi:hypothetical protein